MSELYLMTTIANRNMLPNFLGFYKEQEVSINLITLGRGTAASEVMDYFGLESAEKVVLLGVVTGETWKEVKKGLQNRFRIDVPGMGIGFTIPLASIGGKRELKFLTEQQNYVKEEEGILKETKHELLVVIANQGYSNMIMDAAKRAGAGGGTVIHARGTGMERAIFSISSPSSLHTTLVRAYTPPNPLKAFSPKRLDSSFTKTAFKCNSSASPSRRTKGVGS